MRDSVEIELEQGKKKSGKTNDVDCYGEYDHDVRRFNECLCD